VAKKQSIKRNQQPSRPPRARINADELADELRRRIMTGELPVTSWLRQMALAAEFGVSRMPVREALRKLQASGMVELMPNRGAVVRGPTERDIQEAYVVRAELEGFAAELAAELITDEQLGQLQNAEALFRSAVDRFMARATDKRLVTNAEWPQANDLFHEVILEASGNLRLHSVVEQLHTSFPRNLTWAALSQSARLLKQNVQEHEQIREAIENHEPEAARQAMKEHILRSGRLVAARFEGARDRNASER
jgi:DNA-binding GntR family transcriptional regulator